MARVRESKGTEKMANTFHLGAISSLLMQNFLLKGRNADFFFEYSNKILNFAKAKKEMMAATLDNVSPAILRWAIQRAGYNEEKAVEVFPNYNNLQRRLFLFLCLGGRLGRTVILT